MPTVFSSRDLARLTGVHPDLVAALERVFARMAAAGHAMFVVQGVRTQEQQQYIYAQGRTRPGIIVTMKDGVKNKSDHQVWADNLGHAVDCAFLGVTDPFAITLPWEMYGETVEAEHLTWGGRWSHPHDSPHAQLDSISSLKAA